MTEHTPISPVSRLEVISTGARRRWTLGEKRRIVAESYSAPVSATARRNGLSSRPYEFRHAFAVHRLTAWANERVDVHAKLPWLSAYLGHQNVLGTEVYLKATPQLLELAVVDLNPPSARRPRDAGP